MNHTPAQWTGKGTPRTDAFFNRKPSGRSFLEEVRETMAQLETELTAALAERDKAREAKRPFSDALAQKVIDGQVKELDRLRELVAFHSARFDKLNDEVRIVAGIRDGIETVCGLTAALSSHAEWQPIETAPKDGSQRIIIAQFRGNELVDIDFDAVFEKESESWEMPQEYWVWKSAFGRVEEPTHWTPLPALRP